MMFKRFRARKLSLVVAGIIIIYSSTINLFTFSSMTISSSAIINQDHPKLTVDSDIYVERKRLASNACFKSHVSENVLVYSDKLNKLEFCAVAKAGSTFWMNVLRFINNETGEHQYSSPFEIPRIVTHGGAIFTNLKYIYRDKTKPVDDGKSLRFMFVREPYSRLWSAWIDKFVLPGYWFYDAVNIARYFNASNDIVACPKDISFVQFLTYITRDEVMHAPKMMDHHWKPYHYLCDPCFFKPHVIGKMETFSKDTRVILEAVNYTWVLSTPKSDSSFHRSVQEMRMLTVYNFQWANMSREAHRSCINDTDIYKRLWTAFQMNGHLPVNIPFPYHVKSDMTIDMEEFIKRIEETYIECMTELRLHSKHMKLNAMVEAYRTVPIKIIRKLQNLYALDFEMFGYDSFPAELFFPPK